MTALTGRWRIFVSANQCSLALDIDEAGIEEQNLSPSLLLHVHGRYLTSSDGSSQDCSSDVVVFGGTLTVSF